MTPLHLLQRLRLPRGVDPPLMLALLSLMAFGMVALHSASGGDLGFLLKNAVRLAVGLGALFALALISPNALRRWTPWIYAVSVLLLLAVAVFGEGRGAQRWLDLGVLRFQPSELMKLAVPMMVAAYLHDRALPPSWRDLGVCALLIAVPVGLVAEQPNLSTAVLIGLSGAFVIFLAGLSWLRIGVLILAAVASLPVVWQLIHDYQRRRVLTLLAPDADPLGAGWNSIQSTIAVGSGGLTGKGFGEGTQARLDFLPEAHTDFVLAVYAEEWGLLGVLLLLLTAGFIVGRALWLAAQARDTYGRLLGGAIALTFFVYVAVNAGMVSGVLPVVGVPLPLMSYGGTSAVSVLIGFGVLASIYGHRKIHH